MHLTAFFSGILPQAGWNQHNWKEKQCNVNTSQATALYSAVLAIYSSQLAVSNSRIYKLPCSHKYLYFKQRQNQQKAVMEIFMRFYMLRLSGTK